MDNKHENIKSNSVQFFLYVIGYFFNIGPYMALCGLQSSINIEASIGTISLGVAYVVSFFTCIFITPIVIRSFGCKCAFLIGEVAHLLYVAANFYPTKYVMMAVGVIVGIGEGLVWTSLAVYSTFFGAQHAVHGSRHLSVYIRKYTGIFFGVFYAAQVTASAVTYALLYGGKHVYDQSSSTNETYIFNNKNNSNSNRSYIFTHENTSLEKLSNVPMIDYYNDPYEHCGAKDCQDPEITSSRINNYVLAEKKFLYILLGVFTILSSFGIILHIRFLPVAKPETESTTIFPEEVEIIDQKPKEDEQSYKLKSTLVATYKHCISRMQLLLVPILLYNGLFYGFYLSELSRAFSSCILGVEKVGLSLMVFSTACAVSSFISPKVFGYFGRNKIIPVMLMMDLSNYMFCLLWKPQDDNTALVYMVFVMFGITDSLWKNAILTMYNDYFPGNQEIAFTAWNLWITVGIAISFCWSPLLCVNVKIYTQSTLLILSVAAYGIAEFLYRSKRLVRRESQSFREIKVRSSITG